MNYAQQDENSQKKLTGFVIVVIFHIAAAYALVNGLARKIVEVMRPPLETKVLEEIKKTPPPQEPPPAPPPPRLTAPPPPYIPPPEVQVQPPPQAVQNTITAVTTTRPLEPIRPPGQPVVRTGAALGEGGCEKPPYPIASRRANETGVVVLELQIDVDGSVLQSRIRKSSGYRRLDDVARSAAIGGMCKFRPAMVDGRPEKGGWTTVEFSFRLD